MSRKRDTNWSRDEITVLLDSIIEITKTRAEDGKKINSREVFEYASKQMLDKGHPTRASREKCRTKWKKMKEEFNHAKKARDGDTRYKEAPGIQPFFDRMEEFINGNFDNISPHSTIVRRTSSLSSGRPSSSGSGAASTSSNGNGVTDTTAQSSSNNGCAMRASARIAANTTNGTSSLTTTNGNNIIENNNTISNNQNLHNLNNSTKSTSNSGAECSINLPARPNLSPRQNHHRPPNSTINSNSNNTNNNSGCSGNNITPSSSSLTNTTPTSHHQINLTTPCSQPHSNSKGDACIYSTSAYNASNSQNNINGYRNSSTNHNDSVYPTVHDHADISYRVSSGCRQITIFGDHDVDIKFRGDCITINKIDSEFTSTEPNS